MLQTAWSLIQVEEVNLRFSEFSFSPLSSSLPCLLWLLQGPLRSPLFVLLVLMDLRHAWVCKRPKVDSSSADLKGWHSEAVTHAPVRNHKKLISSLSWTWIESFLWLANALSAVNGVSLWLPRKCNAIPSYPLYSSFCKVGIIMLSASQG